jgi:GDP/UDP-N,N'-diacetylbacillosamine 2-epimerase (hydrolysing)
MKKVCLVTSSRADYGILKPLIYKMYNNADISFFFVVTGMHLCSEFGYTYHEIENDGFKIHKKIDIQLASDNPAGMSKTMGMALICFAEYFEEYKLDLLVVLGDRYEIAAVCCAAVNQHIPIVHLHGGELTEGAIDDRYRHAITKMSSLHFVASEAYRKRVIQLGENPQTVFNVGAIGVENIKNVSLLSIEELEKSLNFGLQGCSYCVVTFHPATLEENTGAKQMRELMDALDEFPEMHFIITKSNSDAGGREINRLWGEYGATRNNCLVVSSLGVRRYLSALRYASMMIGNSSSGIIEGPASKIPTINIGDRQKGRIMAESVICCETEKDAIVQAIKKALTPQFQKLSKEVVSPYGDGNTSSKIMEILREQLEDNKIKIKKEFFDLEIGEK